MSFSTVPTAVVVHVFCMVILIIMLIPTFIHSSDEGPSSHKVLSLDEQKWWLGMDANQGISHSTSYKPGFEANVMSELYCQVSSRREEDASNLGLHSSIDWLTIRL